LARTGCYGSCPSYEVEVHGDGREEVTLLEAAMAGKKQ
jgi:hypothetical protein